MIDRNGSMLIPYPGGALTAGGKTLVMGILNVTPDSFSDGGRFAATAKAVEHALAMIAEGADIVDIGGESTRPGAESIPENEEIRRVVPVVEALKNERIVVSIDTSKAAVAERAIDAGARIVNDVTGLRGDPRMSELVARRKTPVVIMHMIGTPRTMQANPVYRDVVEDIGRFFEAQIAVALGAGIEKGRIILDPGIGFGKLPEHNAEIIRRLAEFRSLGMPLLVGPSRKSFIGHYLNRRIDERLMGTAAAVAAAILNGADIVRVHDVKELRDVVAMCDILKCPRENIRE